jgi:hypothetical protein
MPPGRRDQRHRSEPFDGEVGSLTLRRAEEFGRELVEAGREAAGLGVNETGRQRAHHRLAALGEAGKALRQLVKNPAVEIIEAGEDRVFPLCLETLTLGFGARHSLGVRRRRVGLCGERRVQGRRLFRRTIVRLGPPWPRASPARAAPCAPFLDPLRRRFGREPVRFVDTEPQHGQHVLARKLAARAGTLVAGALRRHHDAIGRRTGALTFAPQHARIGVGGEHRPRRGLHEFKRGCERRLVGRKAFDTFACEGHP